MEIRDARESDLPGLLLIYNEVLAASTAVFSEVPVTLEDRTQWWRARVALGYPVLIASDSSGVVGFGTFGDFRSWPGYRFTVEHSVHVRVDQRGRGIGTQIVRELISRAQALGKHVMVAGIDSANSGSIRMHERLGFERTGEMREVGFKFGRWLDLTLLQKHLSQP